MIWFWIGFGIWITGWTILSGFSIILGIQFNAFRGSLLGSLVLGALWPFYLCAFIYYEFIGKKGSW